MANSGGPVPSAPPPALAAPTEELTKKAGTSLKAASSLKVGRASEVPVSSPAAVPSKSANSSKAGNTLKTANSSTAVPVLNMTTPSKKNSKRGVPSTLTSALSARQHHELGAKTLSQGIELLNPIIDLLQNDQTKGTLSVDISHITDPDLTKADILDTLISVIDERSKPSIEFVLGVLGAKEVPPPLLERQRSQGQRALLAAVRSRAAHKRREAVKAAKRASAREAAARQAAKAAALAKAAAARAAVKAAAKAAAEREAAERAAESARAAAAKKAAEAEAIARASAAKKDEARKIAAQNVPARNPIKIETEGKGKLREERKVSVEDHGETARHANEKEVAKGMELAPVGQALPMEEGVQQPSKDSTSQVAGNPPDEIAKTSGETPSRNSVGQSVKETEKESLSQHVAKEVKVPLSELAKVPIKVTANDPLSAENAAVDVFGGDSDDDVEEDITEGMRSGSVARDGSGRFTGIKRSIATSKSASPMSSLKMPRRRGTKAPENSVDALMQEDLNSDSDFMESRQGQKNRKVESSKKQSGSSSKGIIAKSGGRVAGRNSSRGRRGRAHHLSRRTEKGRFASTKNIVPTSSKSKKAKQVESESEQDSNPESSDDEKITATNVITPKPKRGPGRPRLKPKVVVEDDDLLEESDPPPVPQHRSKAKDAQLENITSAKREGGRKNGEQSGVSTDSLFQRTARERRMSGRRSSGWDEIGDSRKTPRLRRESSNLHGPVEREAELWEHDPMMGMCYRAVNEIPLSIASLFQEPVKEKDAPGYYDAIKKPMDLSTIRENILNGTLSTPAEVLQDMMLIVRNCVQFNGKNSDLYDLAKAFRDKAKELIEPVVEKWSQVQKTGVGEVNPDVQRQMIGASSRMRYPSRRSSWKPPVERSPSPAPVVKKAGRGRGRKRNSGTERSGSAAESEEDPAPTRGRPGPSRGRGRGRRSLKGSDRASTNKDRDREKTKSKDKERERAGSGNSGPGRKRGPKSDPDGEPPGKKRRLAGRKRRTEDE